jgi:cytochrome oxidase Cu insertion factor (SCO1/SenC/PrrC family)
MKALAFSLVTLLLCGCAASSALPEYSAVPEFKLTERSGREVSREDLAGQVWIADFIFTHCAGICPTMSANMRKLQDRLPKEIRLVSFSVDPYNDTPEVLTEYANRYGADRERWLFLSGDPKAVQELSVGGFKLALDPSGGTETEPITHSSRFVLVDRNGRIRGYYGTEDAGALDRLTADAKKLF